MTDDAIRPPDLDQHVIKNYGTVSQYARALQLIEREGVHESHLALLRAHLDAPERTLSWRQLAPLVGYPNAEAVKLQYGLFAKRIAKHLGFVKPPGFWLNVLAGWGSRPDRLGHTTFALRPEFVMAVKERKWFGRSGRTTIGLRALHIVQGGIANGDKAWLEQAPRSGVSSGSWVAPRSAVIGDDVVVYIGGIGFFATAKVASLPKRRRGWARRYGCSLNSIELIEPAISLPTVLRHVPSLTWGHYPRSIATPSPKVAESIRALIQERRVTRRPELDDEALDSSNLEELRAVALLRARPSVPAREANVLYRAASRAIRAYVLGRANGACEGCGAAAPFATPEGTGYLEPHHTTRLADEGPDHPERVIALCPNCHRRAHYSSDADRFNRSLRRKLLQLEWRPNKRTKPTRSLPERMKH